MTGDELRQIRHALGLTQCELAESMGMHRNTVACMERGVKRISTRTARVIQLLQMAGRQDTAQS